MVRSIVRAKLDYFDFFYISCYVLTGKYIQIYIHHVLMAILGQIFKILSVLKVGQQVGARWPPHLVRARATLLISQFALSPLHACLPPILGSVLLS